MGLYRDDGLMIVNLKCTSGKTADKARKDLHVVFQQLGQKVTAEINHQVVNVWNITLNLLYVMANSLPIESRTMTRCT